MAPLNFPGPREPPSACLGPPHKEAQPSPQAGCAAPQLSSLSPCGRKCHPGSLQNPRGWQQERAGMGQMYPRPPSPAGLRGVARPRQAGKESENRFLFFHRVPSIYRPGRSGSFHPGHPERTGPRAFLRPTWSISRLGQPAWERCLEAGLGQPGARGRGAEPRERNGTQPFGQKLSPGTARAGSMQININ